MDVEWDNGNSNSYRYGKDSAFDVKVRPGSLKQRAPKRYLAIERCVMRVRTGSRALYRAVKFKNGGKWILRKINNFLRNYFGNEIMICIQVS